MTLDDVINETTKANSSGLLPYDLPKTYMRRNKFEDVKLAPDKKNLSADGVAFSISKSKRPPLNTKLTYGKDGKEPPHSYLNVRQWYVKKGDKSVDKDKKFIRKTYIDDVMTYCSKNKFPGPDQYFKDQKKKKEDKRDEKKDGKKLTKPNFLDDYQYIGMNNPAPGAYNPEVLEYVFK